MSSATPMATSRAAVLYDGQCAFCQKSVALLKRLDWLGQLRYQDARYAAHLPVSAEALVPERLLEEMHVVTPDGRGLYHGFTAVRWLAWRLPLMWPFAPLFYIPGVPRLGQRLYLWIARNRFRLVPCHGGVCSIHPGEIHAAAKK